MLKLHQMLLLLTISCAVFLHLPPLRRPKTAASSLRMAPPFAAALPRALDPFRPSLFPLPLIPDERACLFLNSAMISFALPCFNLRLIVPKTSSSAPSDILLFLPMAPFLARAAALAAFSSSWRLRFIIATILTGFMVARSGRGACRCLSQNGYR